jgi:hypothetical protein
MVNYHGVSVVLDGVVLSGVSMGAVAEVLTVGTVEEVQDIYTQMHVTAGSVQILASGITHSFVQGEDVK